MCLLVLYVALTCEVSVMAHANSGAAVRATCPNPQERRGAAAGRRETAWMCDDKADEKARAKAP